MSLCSESTALDAERGALIRWSPPSQSYFSTSTSNSTVMSEIPDEDTHPNPPIQPSAWTINPYLLDSLMAHHHAYSPFPSYSFSLTGSYTYPSSIYLYNQLPEEEEEEEEVELVPPIPAYPPWDNHQQYDDHASDDHHTYLNHASIARVEAVDMEGDRGNEGHVNPFVRKRPLPADESPSPKRARHNLMITLPAQYQVSPASHLDPDSPDDDIDTDGNVNDQSKEGVEGDPDQPDDVQPIKGIHIDELHEESRVARGEDPKESSQEEMDDERAKLDQWKVGKRPGHQGSYVKNDDGRKKTLNESISSNAEKVLRKPFRSPAKVVLEPAKPKPSPLISSSTSSNADYSSSPASHQAETPHSSWVGQRDEPEPFPLDLITPPSSSTTSSRKLKQHKPNKKLIKPFKTPARVDRPLGTPSRGTNPSTSPDRVSPYPTPGAGGITLAPARTTADNSTPGHKSDKVKLREIQEQIRVLKRALHILDHPEEDEAIKASIYKWSEAGQEITQRLFQILPKPDDLFIAPPPVRGSWGYDQGPQETSLTREEEEMLEQVERDENGDIIGEYGEEGVKDWEGFDKMIEAEYQAARQRNKGREYVPNRWTTRPAVQVQPMFYGPDPTAWNEGVMLFKLGLRPEILGWNAAEEDWGEIDINEGSQQD